MSFLKTEITGRVHLTPKKKMSSQPSTNDSKETESQFKFNFFDSSASTSEDSKTTTCSISTIQSNQPVDTNMATPVKARKVKPVHEGTVQFFNQSKGYGKSYICIYVSPSHHRHTYTPLS